MATIEITSPVEELCTLKEAKDYLRVIHDDENTIIELAIKVARDMVETWTRRSLTTRTLETSLDNFPSGREIKLEFPPLQSVTSIKYIDSNGDEQTLSDTRYSVDTSTTPGRVWLNSGESWPTVDDIPSAVKIRYVAGYEDIKRIEGMLSLGFFLILNHVYTNRDLYLTGPMANVSELPLNLEKILYPYRV